MDVFLTLAAAVAGVLSLLWVVFIGQKSLGEWIRERKKTGSETITQDSENPLISPPSHSVLHNLPPRTDFVGREREKKQVHEALKSRFYLTMIDGIGGIGKTSLALEVLHECLAASHPAPNEKNPAPSENGVQTFDAFIWTSARDRDLNLNDVLDTIARVLDYPFITQLPAGEKRHEVIKRLQQQPCLLIVDNFETVTDEELHRFILDLPEPGKCLITSRTLGLRQARSVSLRGMAKEEALLLIKNEGIRLGLSLEALTEDEQNFQRFYEATGGAPLAIRWAIGQIKQRGQSIEGVLNSLHGAHGDIFEFIFQRAWSLLSEPAKQILTIMPVFAASASKAAIEAAGDVHHWELDEALGQLVELWLLEASEQLDEAKRRYQLHPLTRAYAQGKLAQAPELERQARVRLAGFFEEFAIERGGDRWSWERYDEIEEEKDNIFELIEWCFGNGEGLVGMKLTKSVTFFMSLRAYPHESLSFGEKAVRFAKEDGRTNDLAWLLSHGIGWREIHGGDLNKGEVHVREALRIYEELQDYRQIAITLRTLGRILRYKGDFDSAEHSCKKGLTLAEASLDELTIVELKRELSLLAFSKGNLTEAKKGLESIEVILRERDILLLPSILGDLAKINFKLKQYDTAFKVGIESFELAKKMKRRDILGWISKTLAYIENERGNYQPALSYAQQALEYYERSGVFFEKIEETKTLIHQLQEKLAK